MPLYKPQKTVFPSPLNKGDIQPEKRRTFPRTRRGPGKRSAVWAEEAGDFVNQKLSGIFLFLSMKSAGPHWHREHATGG